jgi:hypothetical protein
MSEGMSVEQLAYWEQVAWIVSTMMLKLFLFAFVFSLAFILGGAPFILDRNLPQAEIGHIISTSPLIHLWLQVVQFQNSLFLTFAAFFIAMLATRTIRVSKQGRQFIDVVKAWQWGAKDFYGGIYYGNSTSGKPSKREGKFNRAGQAQRSG